MGEPGGQDNGVGAAVGHGVVRQLASGVRVVPSGGNGICTERGDGGGTSGAERGLQCGATPEALRQDFVEAPGIVDHFKHVLTPCVDGRSRTDPSQRGQRPEQLRATANQRSDEQCATGRFTRGTRAARGDDRASPG